MGGSLLQLVAVGVQDVYLIGNPQMTFFKTVYKKYTNFSIESMQQVVNGKPDFGQIIKLDIERKGDLIKDIIFDILLPALPAGYYYTDGIGNALIKQVDLEIGGQLIDRHYSNWLDITSQLSINASKIGAYNAMVGNYNSLGGLYDNALVPLRLHVPMFFFFNKEWGMALPLIALQYHEVSLKIYLRNLNECIRSNSTSAMPGVPIEITSFRVWVDYINLDMDERKEFANGTHEYLIEQVQTAGDEFISSSQNSIPKKLDFNHPVKELYWVHVLNQYAQQNIQTGNQILNYFLPNVAETFNEGVLQLNGIDRFEKRPANYFRLVQNYQYHTRYSLKNIYTYSFALYPERSAPSGTCNMSKFTNINLYLDYFGITHADMLLRVYGVNYNIFRIMNGMGGLSFSN